MKKFLVTATPLSTAFFSISIIHDFQDSPDNEEDTRSSQEYLNDLEEEYQERDLLAKSKRFFKKGSQRFSSAKATDDTVCHKCCRRGYFARDYFSKTSVLSYSSPFQKPHTIIFSPSQQKPELRPNKDFEAKYNKDEEDVSFDDNKMTEVKVLMALANEESTNVGKESARNIEWVKISMRKHINTEILKENKSLRKELKELTTITETWLNSSNKVNQCISEQIPSQKKRILGLDQLIEDPSSVERPWLSKVKGFTLPNHDTGRILLAESQVKITDPLVVITDSSATEFNLADESSVCSTTLPPLEKLASAEPIFGPKTIKSILKSNSTFKDESSKGVIINEPSSAPAKGNKNDSALKNNLAPTGKLKNVKSKDDSLSIVMKELKDLKLQISKNQSPYSRNNKPQQVP
ncbi:hypothetical protein Tco_0741286 [Tanacetum coccineum]